MRLHIPLVLLLLASCQANRPDPIDALVANLNTDPMWINGLHPFIRLTPNATPEEVTLAAAAAYDLAGVKIINVKPVLIDCQNYTAARIQTNSGIRIIVFQFTNDSIGWFAHLFGPPDA